MKNFNQILYFSGRPVHEEAHINCSLSFLGDSFFCPAVLAAKSHVLLINSYHPGFPTFFKQIDGLKSVLSPAGVHLDVEFMDSKRFMNKENLSAFRNMLKMKLASLDKYNIVVTSDDNALNFV